MRIHRKDIERVFQLARIALVLTTAEEERAVYGNYHIMQSLQNVLIRLDGLIEKLGVDETIGRDLPAGRPHREPHCAAP